MTTRSFGRWRLPRSRYSDGPPLERAEEATPIVGGRGPWGTAFSAAHTPDRDRHADGRPACGLPGIALERGLALWSEADVYRRYLRRFARTYADSVAAIAAAEPTAAHQLAHQIKGVAGNLGLTEVATRAGALERHLAQGATTATTATNALVAELQEAFDTALDSIARYAPETSTELSAQPQEPVARTGSASVQAHVASLLRQILAACEQFDPMVAGPALEALSAQLPSARLAPLRQAIDDFDAPSGAALVRVLAHELHIQLED